MLGSFARTYDASNRLKFAGGHAFMLLGYNASSDKFIIRNPGMGEGGFTFVGQFEASFEEFWNSNVKAQIALSEPVGSNSTDYSYD